MANEHKVSAELCAQCAENARWNEAGGYAFLAEQCRQYCRNGHREPEAACSQPVAPGPDVRLVQEQGREWYSLQVNGVHLWRFTGDEATLINDKLRQALAAPPAVSTPPSEFEQVRARWFAAVSTPRCPPVEEIACVIYERAFDCQWAETKGAERALWLAVAENVAAQFFQPVSQPSPVCRQDGFGPDHPIHTDSSYYGSHKFNSPTEPAQPSPEGERR